MPELFEVVSLNQDGYENLPEPTVPYFVHAKEGDYLHRNTQIGNALIKSTWTETQKHLGRVGYAGGVFTWKGPAVPASIINQARSFFLRIFEAKKSEAEVLITKHNDTGEFRLFVPYQRVSYSGVKSIYEPTHVSREYTVVGTLHSHCDFTAFHSGTDSGDASDMDGVHFTIGGVNRSVPEIVGMVTMNGKEFHYKEVADIAEVHWSDEDSAPTWWDQYVFSHGEAPAEKPRGLISLTQEHWDEFLGRALVKPKPHVVSAPVTTYRDSWGKNWGGQPKNYDWRREVYGAGKPSEDIFPSQFLPQDYGPTNEVINNVLDFAEKGGVFTDYDWEIVKPADMDDLNYWKGFFINRLNATLETLSMLDIEFEFKRKKGK